jgi:hypothetical protein
MRVVLSRAASDRDQARVLWRSPRRGAAPNGGVWWYPGLYVRVCRWRLRVVPLPGPLTWPRNFLRRA